jgi:glutathione S-transferase
MITVHHLNNSRSQRILWLLEELSVPYSVVHYERDPDTLLAPPALAKVHPLGKSPVIVDGAHVIAESGAIVDYIIDIFGQGRLIPPPGSNERLQYTYWLHFAEGTAMPPLLMALVFGEIPKRMPAIIRPLGRAINKGVRRGFLQPMLDAHMALMQTQLATAAWFAGPEFTAADIMMSFPIETANAHFGLAGHPALQTWLTRIHQRPAYRAALITGGPYIYATEPGGRI